MLAKSTAPLLLEKSESPRREVTSAIQQIEKHVNPFFRRHLMARVARPRAPNGAKHEVLRRLADATSSHCTIQVCYDAVQSRPSIFVLVQDCPTQLSRWSPIDAWRTGWSAECRSPRSMAPKCPL